MRISLQLPIFTYPNHRENVANIAKTADQAGFYSMWVMDHFFQLGFEPLGPAEAPMLEAYTTLGYIAGITENMKLGTLVTGVIYRNPAVLVKQVTTLDVLSGGRAYLGIGAAWYERETKAYGYDFPPVKTRFEMLEDALQIAHQMWSDNDGPFEGKQYQLQETLNNPPPVTQPHPPILIGGMGEKKTLRFVAQYADACNLFAAAPADVLTHKLNVLKQHCEEIGRDYDEIEVTGLTTAFYKGENLHLESADDVLAFCEKMRAHGIDHMIFNMPETETLKPLELFGGKIIPAVAEL